MHLIDLIPTHPLVTATPVHDQDTVIVRSHGGKRRVAAVSHGTEAIGKTQYLVAMAHPDLETSGASNSLEQATLAFGNELGVTEFPLIGGSHLTAEQVRQELHAVADAEYGDAQFNIGALQSRRAFGIHRGRPAAQHQAEKLFLLPVLGGLRIGPHLAVDMLLTDPSGDELRVLGPEVQDKDLLLVH